MSSTAAIELLSEMRTPLCEDYMYEAIRHVYKHVPIECEHEADGDHCCGHPGRYDGHRIARLVNMVPDLVNEIHRLNRF